MQEKHCSKCNSLFIPPPSMKTFVCNACRRAYMLIYRATKRQQALDKGEKYSPGRKYATIPKYQEWKQKYYSRPDIKQREAEKQRKYRKDPVCAMKNRARRKVRHEITKGRMTKLPCNICGNANVQAHHSDYNKPLEVQWLCRKCHLELHYNTD